MADSCNGTQTLVLSVFWGSFALWTLLAVVSTMLLLSLAWNILCCAAKCCSERGTMILPRFRRSLRLTDMEDNPIYGNINYIQTRVDPLHPPSSPSQQRVNSDFQSQNQDCYANLTLKAPKPLSGRSSPKIHYSDVVDLLGPLETEKEAAGNTDTASTISDLYASVQTQRSKTLDTGGSAADYANHI